MSEPNNRGRLGGWLSGALDTVQQERELAEAKGREAYEEAIRTGRDVQARTRAELIALGRSRLAQEAAQAAQTAARAAREPNTWREAGAQADAAARAAANTLTMGAADHVAAFGDALIDHPSGDIGGQYRRNLADQRAIDSYDQTHRPLATAAGDGIGIGASLADGFAAGRGFSNALSPAMKGNLGEMLSAGKSLLSGDLPMFKPGSLSLDRQPIQLLNGRRTIPDHVQRSGRVVEAKFGFSAGLTRNQRQAQRELGPMYRVDRWTPDHIGYAAGGFSGGASGLHAWDDEQQ